MSTLVSTSATTEAINVEVLTTAVDYASIVDPDNVTYDVEVHEPERR